jgi:hypothetical protein
VWAGMLAHFLGSLTVISCFIALTLSNNQKLWFAISGLLSLTAVIITVIWPDQMSEFIRRQFEFDSLFPIVGSFYKPFGGSKVSWFHNYCTHSFVFFGIFCSVVCFSIATGFLIVNLRPH